jgi:lauroyl/myristoyl acyltransferase
VSSFYYLARSGNTLARWTPQSTRRVVGSSLAAASYLGWSSKRLVTHLNMAQVTGRPTYDPHVRRLAFASWRNYGRYAADFMSFPHLKIDNIERKLRDLSEGKEGWLGQIQSALHAGRGAIIASAHFGNWDMAGALVALHHPISAVTETFSDEKLNRLLQDQRKDKGMGIIPMEGSARRILRVLHQNQFVAIVVDRPVTEDQGTAVTFFGRKTYVPSGPAALALKSGAAIVPGFVWYGQRNELYVRAFPPIFPQESKGEQRVHEIARLTQLMYDALEEMIREYPAQWYMFRQFWPTEK